MYVVSMFDFGILLTSIGANVLVTEQGGVQLCDFGIAGVVESKFDKRSTMIGTPHWMAPELFDGSLYGKEVDIWSFGAMVYEIATGFPPNAVNQVSVDRLRNHLKNFVPRLEGGNYSEPLRNLVAYCLEEDPKARPTIEQVQKHNYIANSSSAYPTSSLSSLVGSFKLWESAGGSRKSLFMAHGAQGPTSSSSPVDDDWNFSTTEIFDQRVAEEFTAQDVIDAYGSAVVDFDDDTARPTQRQPVKASRRRPPPEALSRLPAQPLEKIFDPNTLTNYEENSRAQYGGEQQPPSTSDLPLRDDSAHMSIRDTLIDLGGHDTASGLSSFSDMDTIKAGYRARDGEEDQYVSTVHDFSKPALSDPADINPNRRTQDWKFPSMEAPPASADPEVSMFRDRNIPRPPITPGLGGRPALIHHPTEPIGGFGGGLANAGPARQSMRESLIDLDMGMPDMADYSRPSTAVSDAESTSSDRVTYGNPFELESHVSVESHDITNPPLIEPPSVAVLTGAATREEMSSETHRILGGFIDQMSAASYAFSHLGR
jgi:serine/threonine protein kinase